MESIDSTRSDGSFKSPQKTPADMKPETSDQNHISATSSGIRTPQKLPKLLRRFKHHRQSHLPENYEMILRFFDALIASLKLLRFRKSVPVFTKIRAMIETMSERRFTHQNLAQLKFLLPEMGVKRVLFPDENTRCMKYDIHLSLNDNLTMNTKKRKRGIKHCSLRDCFISRLLEFLRSHPEGTEIPMEDLPEPFNLQKQAQLLNTTEPSSSFSNKKKHPVVSEGLQPAKATHFSESFKTHFSKGELSKESEINFKRSSKSFLQSSVSVSQPSVDDVKLPYQAATQSKQEPYTDEISQNAKTEATTPIKSAEAPMKLMVGTPALQTPKRRRMSPDKDLAKSPNKVYNRPSCAKSLHFDCPPTDVNIELSVDDSDSLNILDMLPADLLQSVKDKERRITEQAKRKQIISNLPKLFDRIYYLFQSPKSSAIMKDALIRDLTECHADITDQSEIEQQLTMLQENIPDWLSPKISPSGKILYRINKALDPNTLRLRLNNAM